MSDDEGGIHHAADETDPFVSPPPNAAGGALPQLVTSLPPEIITNLKDIFKLLDQSNCGYLNLRELAIALSLADFDCTPEERTGLVAVHCADKSLGLTENEFISICDLIYNSRKDQTEYSTEEKLKKAFDALASNEHGVVPLEGVLGWGEAVMKACEECLVMEHGFEYGEGDVDAMAAARRRRRNQQKKKKMAFSLDGVAQLDDDDDEDVDMMSDDGGSFGSGGGQESPMSHTFSSGSLSSGAGSPAAAKELKFDQQAGNATPGGGGGSATAASAAHVPPRARLVRRRSSSAMLVPRAEETPEDSPVKKLKLPEVMVQQQRAGAGAGSGAAAATAANRSSSGRFASFSKSTLGGKTLISHHPDAATVFSNDDVDTTANWLLNVLGERYYKNSSEGEKREVEMLLELARAAGHTSETVSSILTRDAFVKFMQDPEGLDVAAAAGANTAAMPPSLEAAMKQGGDSSA